eukprot:CAMPEP_0202876228 /NCGR_PEP_ID=MMETSP1391-20130828/28675_1 /ASSEMBLY_ACC=CAM_ASM_000867 /TAXON_ID=1034604 /ORGANISM="Chlamydomonas leiostraca, Strain SAG 11-49" /LENGTH=340 /DNA_ID=CAMNT_0049558033 /DNA_START=86 /DNA_END=1109 /DNA_ORIENTATION=+
MPGPWGRFVERISSQLAFFPPSPPSYTVLEHQDASRELYIQPTTTDIPKVLQCSVMKVDTSPTPKGGHGGGQTIVTAYVPYRGTPTQTTILYSHGNAVDLGQMLPIYRELGKLLKVNVMGYDYTGYGSSTGTPTVGNTFSDIKAVYDTLVTHYNIPATSIIAYGQSVGSGPTAWLGAQEPNLAGVVLHSPLLSGVRVLSPGLRWWPAFADVYPNHQMAPKIKAPVLVMHGTEDEVIHISCGQKLASLAKNKYPPFWAQGYNHQNLETSPEYLPTLQKFIHHVAPRPSKQPAAALQEQVQGRRQLQRALHDPQLCPVSTAGGSTRMVGRGFFESGWIGRGA